MMISVNTVWGRLDEEQRARVLKYADGEAVPSKEIQADLERAAGGVELNEKEFSDLVSYVADHGRRSS